MVKNYYPLPSIDNLFDQLHGATMFSKIDLRSGYHQLMIMTEHILKTAFYTYMTIMKFWLCLLGLTNAPVGYMDLMTYVLMPELLEFDLLMLWLTTRC